MGAVKAERRMAERKHLEKVVVTELTSLSNYQVIASRGIIVDASVNGFLLSIYRKDLVPEDLRNNLTIEHILGQQLAMFLPQMNLDLDGRVIRTQHKGNGYFEVAIEFSNDVPEYWRECLIDLLPGPGEI